MLSLHNRYEVFFLNDSIAMTMMTVFLVPVRRKHGLECTVVGTGVHNYRYAVNFKAISVVDP